ncbi:MAG: hypothetical protein ACUVX8_11570 [Candidatus Zipacnadales bacterium]
MKVFGIDIFRSERLIPIGSCGGPVYLEDGDLILGPGRRGQDVTPMYQFRPPTSVEDMREKLSSGGWTQREFFSGFETLDEVRRCLVASGEMFWDQEPHPDDSDPPGWIRWELEQERRGEFRPYRWPWPVQGGANQGE